MQGINKEGHLVFDWELYILGNRTCFKTPLTGSQLFWAPDSSGGKATDYNSTRPNTANQCYVGGAKGIVFEFRQSKMFVYDMPWWAMTGLRRRIDDTRYHEGIQKETYGTTGKSNIFGISLNGPFSWMARLLKSAGAKLVYNVSSPKVIFKWTAYDLAKYCDRIALATQRGAYQPPTWSFDDSEDD